MTSGFLAIGIALFVLLLAGGMKAIAKTEEYTNVFWACVGGFLLIYILAAIAISWLLPSPGKSNVNSFFQVFSDTGTSDGFEGVEGF